jgi:hypothetical protein
MGNRSFKYLADNNNRKLQSQETARAYKSRKMLATIKFKAFILYECKPTPLTQREQRLMEFENKMRMRIFGNPEIKK